MLANDLNEVNSFAITVMAESREHAVRQGFPVLPPADPPEADSRSLPTCDLTYLALQSYGLQIRSSKGVFMRRLILSLLSVFLFSLLVSAQTVDEIIAKSWAAHGGLSKLKAIQSVKITGDVELGGMQAGFTQVFKRPMKIRADISVQGMSMVQAFDGKTGWQIVPFSGKKDPEVMSADDLKNIQEEADFDGPMVDYKKKGNTVELVGKEKVEGTDTYHLKVTLKNGNVRHIYMDADSFLAIKVSAKTTMRGTEIEVETAIGDYKKVEGIMVPFSIEQRPVG